MSKPIVSIVKGEDVEKTTRKSIDLLGGMENFVERGDRVLIKPNFTVTLPPETGVTTDPKVVEVLADLAFKAGAKEVTIAEGASSNDLVEMDGLGDVAWRTGAKIVDINKLSGPQIVNAKIPDPLILKEIPLPVVILESDVVLNVPKMKTGGMGVTLGLKNLVGATPGKGRWFEWSGKIPRNPFVPAGGKKILHALRTDKGRLDGLLRGIRDLNKIIHSDLTVIDGMWAMEGRGPLHGSPVRMGVIISGTNVVATDAVGAAVMGFDPTKIDMIRIAAESGLGTNDLSQIEIRGETIERVYRGFEPAKEKFWKAYSKSAEGMIKELHD